MAVTLTTVGAKKQEQPSPTSAQRSLMPNKPRDSSRAALLAMATLFLLLAGCSVQQPTAHPNVNGPRADIETMPTVEFCCDEIAAGLAAAGTNPLWRCDDCVAGNTSTDALGAFPAILAQHPNVVVFVVGTYD